VVTWKVSLNRFPGTPGSNKSGPGFLRGTILQGAWRFARAAISAYIVANIAAVNECRAIACVRTPAWNDDFKEGTTLRAFKRMHHVPSVDRRDFFYDLLDIASDARFLRNHGCYHFPFTFAMASICSLGNFLIAWDNSCMAAANVLLNWSSRFLDSASPSSATTWSTAPKYFEISFTVWLSWMHDGQFLNPYEYGHRATAERRALTALTSTRLAGMDKW
jgi:hypothetical protein